MRNFTLTLISLAMPLIACAQTDTVFVDEYDLRCTRRAATGYLIHKPAENGLYREEQYDLVSHRLEAIYHVVHPDSIRHEGPAVMYHESGQKSAEGHFRHGNIEGEWKHYYDDGSLWYIETRANNYASSLTAYHSNGKLKCHETYSKRGKPSGKRFDENGKETDYFPFHTLPKPPYNLDRYLTKHIVYPAGMEKESIGGRVVLRMTIDSTGAIKNVKVQKHLSPESDAEAVRVVSEMPRWIPATEDGKPYHVVYNLPIVFHPPQ